MSNQSLLLSTENAPLNIINSANPEEIQHNLKHSGALLIRGSGLIVDQYEMLTKELTSSCLIHHGVSTGQRDHAGNEESTATVDKGMTSIPLHREYAYAAGGPDIMMFYCIAPAQEDGETILCDGQAVIEALPTRLRKTIEDMVLEWHWKAPSAYWQTTLGTTSKEEALLKLQVISNNCCEWESQEVNF